MGARMRTIMILVSLCLFRSCSSFLPSRPQRTSRAHRKIYVSSQLETLAGMTVMSVDTGDLEVVAEMSSTGLISDATTNPLFVSQAGLSGNPRYTALVDAAVSFAKAANGLTHEERIELAMDRLACNLGIEIAHIVKGYVSTEVDPRLSFDTEESVRRARRIIDMYEANGVSRKRFSSLLSTLLIRNVHASY